MRGEAKCGKSGRGLEEGDEILRVNRCSHWFLADEIKSLVLPAVVGESEAEANPDGPWARLPAAALPLPELKCPVCSRPMDLTLPE